MGFAFCVGILASGEFALRLGIGALQTLVFVALVFGSQATIYAIRERWAIRERRAIRQHRRMWGSRPSLWPVASSVTDMLVAAILAIDGIAVTPLPAVLVAETLGAAVAFAIVIPVPKGPVFARLGIAWRAASALPRHAVGSIGS